MVNIEISLLLLWRQHHINYELKKKNNSKNELIFKIMGHRLSPLDCRIKTTDYLELISRSYSFRV